MVTPRALTLSLVCLSALGACSRDVPAASTSRDPTSGAISPMRTSEGSPDVAARLGPAPNDCPGPRPRRRTVSPAYAPLVGARPLWAGFYASYDGKRNAFTALDAPRTRDGFRVKVLWVMSPRYEGTVRLAGEDSATGEPLRFHFEELATTTDPELSPEIAGFRGSEWKEFPSYLYFDAAGCFTLRATSDRGSWRLGFGFGRRTRP